MSILHNRRSGGNRYSKQAMQRRHDRHAAEQAQWRKKISVWFQHKGAFIESLEESKESLGDEEKLPSESVSGLGFKDPRAARGSLKALKGSDPDYQLRAVKRLLERAKRALTCTKDETKLSNIKEAMSILETFVDDFDTKRMSRQNCPYLSLGIVRTAEALAGDSISEDQKSFIAAYASARGVYKRLRNVGEAGNTWDIRRNVALKQLKKKNSEAKLFTSNDEATAEHLQFLLWAFSPKAAKVKKLVKETKVPDIEKLKIDRKRKSSGDGESDSKKKRAPPSGAGPELRYPDSSRGCRKRRLRETRTGDRAAAPPKLRSPTRLPSVGITGITPQ